MRREHDASKYFKMMGGLRSKAVEAEIFYKQGRGEFFKSSNSIGLDFSYDHLLTPETIERLDKYRERKRKQVNEKRNNH